MLMLLLCNVFTLSAAEELYAQHYNVTLSLRNTTVKEAVDAVTRQTGIAFSYESSVGVMPLGNVEIRVDGGAVDAVLGPLFADKGIAWQVVDGVVILTRQNSPPQSDSGRRLTVRGRITAGAGESIVGATVMVKGTVLASGPTDTTFTAENLELAFSGVLRHVTLNGSEESIITDDERPFVAHRPSAVQREER